MALFYTGYNDTSYSSVTVGSNGMAKVNWQGYKPDQEKQDAKYGIDKQPKPPEPPKPPFLFKVGDLIVLQGRTVLSYIEECKHYQIAPYSKEYTCLYRVDTYGFLKDEHFRLATEKEIRDNLKNLIEYVAFNVVTTAPQRKILPLLIKALYGKV